MSFRFAVRSLAALTVGAAAGAVVGVAENGPGNVAQADTPSGCNSTNDLGLAYVDGTTGYFPHDSSIDCAEGATYYVVASDRLWKDVAGTWTAWDPPAGHADDSDSGTDGSADNNNTFTCEWSPTQTCTGDYKQTWSTGAALNPGYDWIAGPGCYVNELGGGCTGTEFKDW